MKHLDRKVTLLCPLCVVYGQKRRAFPVRKGSVHYSIIWLYLRFLRCIIRLYFIPASTQADGIRIRDAS